MKTLSDRSQKIKTNILPPMASNGEVSETEQQPISIPQAFKSHGFIYNLILRDNNFAIYSQSKMIKKELKLLAYELHKIRVRKACVFNGKNIPDTERLAGTSEWGTYGWTLQALERAKEKMKELLNA